MASENEHHSLQTRILSNGLINEAKKNKSTQQQQKVDEIPLAKAVLTYLQYAILIFWGYINDFLRFAGLKTDYKGFGKDDLFKMSLEFERFYSRNVYRCIGDCFNRPVGSCPGSELDLLDRTSNDHYWTFKFTGTSTRCLNLGSYNYLGFAETAGPCADAAIKAVYDYGVGNTSTCRDLGTLDVVRELERQVAKFVSKPDALVFGMGFSTNSANIPALMGKGCLILSDELNHASIVTGAKLSGSVIRVFKHNDMTSLELLLRNAVIQGQPRTHRPWRKILIVVEGIYSMEGNTAKLRDIVEFKKKYKAYIYLDEAHSIGAIGSTGRGVTEYLGVNPADIDIMMGTFTKSFGGSGGYIAASHEIVNHLRRHSHCATYGSSMTAPVAMQILTCMKIIMGEDGTNEGTRRVTQLIENSRYFRKYLQEKRFHVYGAYDSPVVPILIYEPGKLCTFSRELRKRKIAVVIVGFPATSIVESRCRICLSASHTKEMLDYALKEIDEIGDLLGMKKDSFIL